MYILQLLQNTLCYFVPTHSTLMRLVYLQPLRTYHRKKASKDRPHRHWGSRFPSQKHLPAQAGGETRSNAQTAPWATWKELGAVTGPSIGTLAAVRTDQNASLAKYSERISSVSWVVMYFGGLVTNSNTLLQANHLHDFFQCKLSVLSVCKLNADGSMARHVPMQSKWDWLNVTIDQTGCTVCMKD